MKKCLTCGSEFTDEKLFCPDCGAKLEEISGSRAPGQGTAFAKESTAAQGTTSAERPAAAQGAAFAEKPAAAQGTISAEKPAPDQGGAAAERPAPGSTAKSSSRVVLPIVILSVLTFVGFITAMIFFFQMNDYSRRLDNSRQAENNMRRESEQAKSELEEVKSELTECQDALERAQQDLAVSAAEQAAIAAAEQGKVDGLRLQELYGYGSENYYAMQSVVVLQKGESKKVTVFYDLSGTVSMSASSGISYDWSGEWSQHKTQVIITGNSTGYYPLKFTNKKNSDSFEILVIVTDRDLVNK